MGGRLGQVRSLPARVRSGERRGMGNAMSDTLTIRITADGHTTFEGPLTGPLELGRQQAGEPEPYGLEATDESAPTRLIVARQNEVDNVSRRHALLEPLPSGRVRLTNRSKAPLPCAAVAGGVLARRRRRTGPAVLLRPARPHRHRRRRRLGRRGRLHSLDEQTVGPGRIADLSTRLRTLPGLTGRSSAT